MNFKPELNGREAGSTCDALQVEARTADAEQLSGSRWYVSGDVAREGRVLHLAR